MTKFKNLKKGDKLSETQYYSVEAIKGDKVQLKNFTGENVVVDKGYVETCLTSANQFEKEEKLSKTDLTNIFLSSANTVFTVSFNKQVKEADVVNEIKEAYEKSTPTEFETKVKKAIKRSLAGEERVLTGYHSGSQDEFGRVQVKDMDVTDGSPNRLVDTRSLNWMILKGIKYTVK